jgi:hypothetical protein
MVGLQAPKASPQDPFNPIKPGPGDPTPVNPTQTGKRRTHDVTIHTTNGTTVIRYEEVAPGQWKKIAELTPEQAAREDKSAPKAAPDGKKVD